MDPAHPAFVPDPTASREEMEALQREIADGAVFADDLPFDAGAIGVGSSNSALDLEFDTDDPQPEDTDTPVVAGIDQAFLDDRVVSAIVCLRGGQVIERVYSVTPLSFPYVPGLLSFREGGPILAACGELAVDPDLLVFDGSGRLHFREAGLATHIGFVLDVPAIGIAKRLLCGLPQGALDDRPVGTRVPIEADEAVSAPNGTILGYAVQTKQWDRSPGINPVFVSPGHRMSAETAADWTLALRDGYKLPEPTRLADAYADEAKTRIES
jgi:deoxyribonuclease V